LRETILSNIASAISWEGMEATCREDVDTTERLIGGCGKPINVVPPAGVCRDGQRATTEPSHFLSGRLTGIKLAARNNHVGSTLGECAHHLQTKPSGASRDQGDLSGQIK
jgi:hypothetical protein